MRCFVGPHGFVYVFRHASRLSETPHWGGGLRTQAWGCDPEIRTLRYGAPPPSFIVLCLLVRKLLCWQTNRRCWNIQRSSLRNDVTLGNDRLLSRMLKRVCARHFTSDNDLILCYSEAKASVHGASNKLGEWLEWVIEYAIFLHGASSAMEAAKETKFDPKVA